MREEYQTFFFDYLHNRIYLGVRDKIARHPDLIEELNDLIGRFPTTGRAKDYSRIEEAVSMAMFDQKMGLMRSFASDAATFAESATSAS